METIMNYDATELTDDERRILFRAACAGIGITGLFVIAAVAVVVVLVK